MQRRNFLKQSMIGGAAGILWLPGVFADVLTTPKQAEGPFYPDKLPLDTDNDLLIINDQITPAVGEVTYLHGTITDAKGTPFTNTLIEIWQVDANGAYLHTRDPRTKLLDKNFQSYGRFLTNRKGEYHFRTIKPVKYPGRVPHIHVKISKGGKHLLTTQIYVSGEAENEKDFLFKRIGDAAGLLLAEFKPLAGAKAGELEAKFDVILGATPSDD
jgi:protocatechuate 3,4-dioxygenase, beta subunit